MPKTNLVLLRKCHDFPALASSSPNKSNSAFTIPLRELDNAIEELELLREFHKTENNFGQAPARQNLEDFYAR